MYRNKVLEFIPKDVRGGVMLEGPKGLFQMQDALLLADEVLGDSHENHPDYLFLSPEGKSITVEMVEGILSQLELYPARAKRRCVVIEGADRMVVQAQNKLLKALEESEVYFILVSYGNMIGTVSSRLMEISYRPLSEDEFFHLTGEKGSSFYATGGCPELLKGDVKEIFEKAGNYLLERNKKELLSILGLVKEKDKKCFYEVHRDLVPSLFCYFGRILADNNGSYENIKKAADAALRSSRTSVYTSADFFKDVVSV